MKKILLAAALLGGTSGLAAADSSPAVVQGAGVKIGEGAELHPTVGIESGATSNVFYENQSANAAGILRLVGELAMSTLSDDRMESGDEEELTEEEEAASQGAPPMVEFRAGLKTAYEEYLSGNNNIQSQRNLSLSGILESTFNPQGAWALGVNEEVKRDTRPTNFESSNNLNRWVNNFRLGLTYQPGGRTIKVAARYENAIDFFEAESSRFADRISHTMGLRGSWQLFPFTELYVDSSLGFAGGLGDDAEAVKSNSMPLRVKAGINTSLTEATSVRAYVGFGKGFYDEGPDFTNVIGGINFGVKYHPTGKMSVGYHYDFGDSINANFYRDHAVEFKIDQRVSQVVFSGTANVVQRAYRGVPVVFGGGSSRDDLLFALRAELNYLFRDWFAAMINYNMLSDQTDYRYMVVGTTFSDDPSFVRHEAVAGIRASF